MKKIENMDDGEFADALKSMDDEKFMEVWTEFGDKVAKDRERLLAFSREHQHRTRIVQLRDMGLNPSDLELLQRLEPEEIQTEEAVGEQPAPADDDTDEENA